MTSGHSIKRGAFWRVFLEYGKQAAQRCPTCHKRFWGDEPGARSCPTEHGELEDIVARRQEMLPGKYTNEGGGAQGLARRAQGA